MSSLEGWNWELSCGMCVEEGTFVEVAVVLALPTDDALDGRCIEEEEEEEDGGGAP